MVLLQNCYSYCCLLHSSSWLAALTLHLLSVQVTAFSAITQNGVTGVLPTGVQFTFSGPPSYNEASSIDSSGSSAPSSPPESPSESPPESSPESSIQSDIASASAGNASASAGGSSQVNAAPSLPVRTFSATSCEVMLLLLLYLVWLCSCHDQVISSATTYNNTHKAQH